MPADESRQNPFEHAFDETNTLELLAGIVFHNIGWVAVAGFATVFGCDSLNQALHADYPVAVMESVATVICGVIAKAEAYIIDEQRAVLQSRLLLQRDT